MSNEYLQDDKVRERIYDAQLMRRMLPFLRPHRWACVAAIGLVLCGKALFLMSPWLLGKIVDWGIKPRDAAMALRLAWIFGGLQLLIFAFTALHSYVLQYVGQRIMFDIRATLFRHVLGQPVSFFDKNPVGRLVTRTTNDVTTLAELFSSGLILAVGDFLLIIGIAVILVALQPLLGLATMTAIPLMTLAAWYFKIKLRDTHSLVRERLALVNATLAENISGMKIIHAFMRLDEQAQRFERMNVAHRDAQLDSVFYQSFLIPVVTVINALTVGIIILLGGHLMRTGDITFGVLISFIAYAQH